MKIIININIAGDGDFKNFKLFDDNYYKIINLGKLFDWPFVYRGRFQSNIDENSKGLAWNCPSAPT